MVVLMHKTVPRQGAPAARLTWVAAALIAVWAGPLAGAPTFPEYEVKAAYLLNFAKFIEWPSEAFADASAPMTIGVLGEDPFGPVLEQAVQGETVANRRLVIRRFKRLEDLKPCHLLFISKSETRRLGEIMRRVKGPGCLTVGETDEVVRQGGVISFFTAPDHKVRFEINVEAAERERLKPSAKLMQVARVVRGTRGREER